MWEKILEGIRALNPDIIVPYLNNEPLQTTKGKMHQALYNI